MKEAGLTLWRNAGELTALVALLFRQVVDIDPSKFRPSTIQARG